MTQGAEFLASAWALLAAMAPYLLLGFLCAGALHVLIPEERIFRHFSAPSVASAVKAALVGVPLPLCSCGIIPVASHFRRAGASRSATISLLASTPATGIDSILATYALLGPFFAIVRPVASAIAGVLAGWMAGFDRTDTARDAGEVRHDAAAPRQGTRPRVCEMVSQALRYGFFDLVRDTGKWILIGVVAGALIENFLPGTMSLAAARRREVSYLVALVASVPLYVCATGSIPIAAGLISAGFPPGAAFVFLFAGPATNTATISFVGGALGRRLLVSYLAAILTVSLAGGVLIDGFWTRAELHGLHHAGMMIPSAVQHASAALLLFLIALSVRAPREESCSARAGGVVFAVPDMTCAHCARVIESRLRNIPSVHSVSVNLRRKEVSVSGTVDEKVVSDALKEAGYQAMRKNRAAR